MTRHTSILWPTEKQCCRLNCDISLIGRHLLISEIKNAKRLKCILESKSFNMLRTKNYLLGKELSGKELSGKELLTTVRVMFSIGSEARLEEPEK